MVLLNLAAKQTRWEPIVAAITTDARVYLPETHLRSCSIAGTGSLSADESQRQACIAQLHILVPLAVHVSKEARSEPAAKLIYVID